MSNLMALGGDWRLQGWQRVGGGEGGGEAALSARRDASRASD